MHLWSFQSVVWWNPDSVSNKLQYLCEHHAVNVSGALFLASRSCGFEKSMTQLTARGSESGKMHLKDFHFTFCICTYFWLELVTQGKSFPSRTLCISFEINMTNLLKTNAEQQSLCVGSSSPMPSLCIYSVAIYLRTVGLEHKAPPSSWGSPIRDPLRKSATPRSTPTHSARMKGRRRPQRKVQRSLADPIKGVNMRPRMGLRNHTKL